MKSFLLLLSVFSSLRFYSIAQNSPANNPLFIPDTLAGETFNLSFQEGETEFYAGIKTSTVGYNQGFLGPTLIFKQGKHVSFNITNDLSETTTVHWHGLHISAENDGGPHTPILPSQVWSPNFTVLDKAATYWYHPHLHENTEEQVTKGGAGFIIVRDAEEAQLTIPRSYGVDDFPIVIQSRAFDADKQFLINTATDNVILTNGTPDAFLGVPAQVIRLRLLNGSTERVYQLGLEGDLMFSQIASDGGLLNTPVSLTRLRLAPGERAEILVDLSLYQGQSFSLKNFGSELPSGIYGASRPSFMPFSTIQGYDENSLNGHDFNILQLNVGSRNAEAIMEIPSTLITNLPYVEANSSMTRFFTFRPLQMGPSNMVNGPFAINDRSFKMDFINFEVPLDQTEIWEVRNLTAIAHPFHIHGIQFYILDIDGAAPPKNLQGRKDVVLVSPMGGTIRLIMRFEEFANQDVPYMYHCHMLSHEDDGMMGQFNVVGHTTDALEPGMSSTSIYPNPATTAINIAGLKSSKIEIYNALGEILQSRETTQETAEFDLSGFIPGIYYFKITTGKSSHTFKVVKVDNP
ncbi:MAG: multicopper oxidase domain-containing protein [Saprospiraceae bacterium]|nr:multicopper oxidase domain-containing protein [Saprospiraceae bacterium]